MPDGLLRSNLHRLTAYYPLNLRARADRARRKKAAPLPTLIQARRPRRATSETFSPTRTSTLPVATHAARRKRSLDDFKLEIDRLAANDVAEISFPKAANETKRGITVASVDEKFYSERAPQICQRNVNANGF